MLITVILHCPYAYNVSHKGHILTGYPYGTMRAVGACEGYLSLLYRDVGENNERLESMSKGRSSLSQKS